MRLISAAVIDAKLPGDSRVWLEQLKAGKKAAYLKLLLTLVPHLKKLLLCFTDIACLDALNEIAAAVFKRDAQYLLHLEKLCVEKGGHVHDPAMIWTLHQPSLLRFPSLRTFWTSRLNIEYHDEDNHAIDSEVSLKIKRLSFSDGFISPTCLSTFLAACPHLQEFVYRADGLQLHDKYTQESQFEPAELSNALMPHKTTLKTLSIPNLFGNCISTRVGALSRSDDLTIGSLADFSSLKHLIIEQVILLGKPNIVYKFILCRGVDRNLSTTECRCGPVCRWRRARSYRLRDVLPRSIQRLEIWECNNDICGHLLELAEARESRFPHLATVFLTCGYEQRTGLLYDIHHVVQDAFRSTVSVDGDTMGRYG